VFNGAEALARYAPAETSEPSRWLFIAPAEGTVTHRRVVEAACGRPVEESRRSSSPARRPARHRADQHRRPVMAGSTSHGCNECSVARPRTGSTMPEWLADLWLVLVAVSIEATIPLR
jgi:hypothetical protein